MRRILVTVDENLERKVIKFSIVTILKTRVSLSPIHQSDENGIVKINRKIRNYSRKDKNLYETVSKEIQNMPKTMNRAIYIKSFE